MGDVHEQRLRDMESRFRELELKLGKFWTFIRELATAFWGDDTTRDNGVRSDVRKLQQVTAELEASILEDRKERQHYTDVTRRETCEGLKELARRDAGQAESAEGDVNVKVARIQSGPQTLAALVSMLGPLLMFIIFLLDRKAP